MNVTLLDFERFALDFERCALDFERCALGCERCTLNCERYALDFKRLTLYFKCKPSISGFERHTVDSGRYTLNRYVVVLGHRLAWWGSCTDLDEGRKAMGQLLLQVI